MKKITVTSLFIFFLISLHLFASDYSVGEIISLSGEVFVDYFGNGSYISAEQGDLLYKNSILKTGGQSKAIIKVMELTKEIPPFSELSIAKVILLESKKKNSGWLDSLINIINHASDAFFEGEESVDLASRGKDEILSKDELFAYETEEDVRPDYWQELSFLLDMTDQNNLDYSTSELELKKGLCYFGLASYQDAQKHLSASLFSIKQDDKPVFFDKLILMLGITHYLLDEYSESIDFFSKFLIRNKIPEYKPFAYWLLLDSMIKTGREDETKILLKKAEKSLNESILRDGFFMFLEDLS